MSTTAVQPAALRVQNLSAAYGAHRVLYDVDFQLRNGAISGLIGPNGAGKSTLLKAILGEVPSTGTIDRSGTPLRDLTSIAYVPQRAAIDFTFPATVLDVAIQGTYAHLPWWRRPGREERQWAHHCLDLVGMAGLQDRSIGHLSGGQAGRVFLARALAQRASLFLLDEPFVGIDMASEKAIIEVLRERSRAGDAVLIVHHNLDQATEYFDDLIALNRTVVASGPIAEVFTSDVLGAAFPAARQIARLGGA